MSPVDVAIVAFRSEDVIQRVVKDALELGGRVVVVDHGDGEAAQLAAALGAVAVHDPANPGFGAGQNRAVSRTTTPLVLLCNPDAEIDPDAVSEGARFLTSHPDVAAVQGVIVNSGTGQPERSAGVELGPLHLLGRAVGARALLRFSAGRALARRIPVLRDHADRVPHGPVEVESLAATAVLVRRSAYEAVGGFDESYFLYGEDLDLCRRLRASGWQLVALPAVWAAHVNGASAESSWHREVSWWQGTMGFAARWWSAPGWSVGLAASLVASARLSLRHPAHAGRALTLMVLQPAETRRRRHHPSAEGPPSLQSCEA